MENNYSMEIADKKPIVSVVMSIYNVEEYLEEAILSIINQSIGFESNIQLIFVDDGSTDNSEKICRQYEIKYPDNIVYIYKENGGQSSARNAGLSVVKGKYINFMDPDDTISKNAFEEVMKFFETNADSLDMVCIPLVYFGAESGLHGKYKDLGEKNRIINLMKNPSDFILSSASSFYKAEIFETLRFDEKLMTEEDTKVNLSVVRRTFQIGYVCEKGVKYNYRRRIGGGSNVDILSTGVDYNSLMAPIRIFEDMMDYDRELAPYEKEIIIYELRSRLKLIKKDGLPETEYNSIIQAYSKWIKKIDIDHIVKTKWLESIEKKVLFLNLSDRSFTELTRNGYISLSERLIIIVDFFIDNDGAHLECRFNNFGEDDFDLVLISSDKSRIIYSAAKVDIDGPFDAVYGEFHVDKTHIRSFTIPRENKEYGFYYIDKKSGTYYKIRRTKVSERSRICSGIKNVGPTADYCYSIKDAILYVKDDLKVITGKNEEINRVIKKQLFGRYLSGEKKFILINDRPQKAGDNGEALFYYIMENECERIRNNTFFVIDKACKDFESMKHKEHIIQFRSLEHLDKFINAKVIYSSHQARAFYYPFDECDFKYYADLLRYKFIWLQHGVSKDDLQKEANKYNSLNDGIVTATLWETNEFKREKYMYSEQEVLPCGFARFDELRDERKKLITVAPTWRKELVGKILPNGHNEPKEEFLLSEFYNIYMRLLKDPSLICFLRDKCYELDFVLHSGFTVYEPLFEEINNDVIHLRKMEDFSYKQCFAESSLFITDFSSTAFDFAYLEKPVIYFQFDEDSFFDKHYNRSDWDYRKNGLGPVINSIDELIDKIIFYVNGDCKIEDDYADRVKNTFLYRDCNNCKRIMDSTRLYCEEEIKNYDISLQDEGKEYLHKELKNKEKELKNKEKELKDKKSELEKCGKERDYFAYCLEETRESFSYKLGYKMTAFPRKIRSIIKGEKE